MRSLSLADFATVRGETLDLAIGEASVGMTLAEVRPLTMPAVLGGRSEPFELIFRSASPVVLPQRIYTFRHAALGTLEIFIVPVARDATGIVYQAVFT